ncbi:MAG: DNA polymerase III subunit chi [Sodalis sp.]|nr:MAG: DNA polymerase III subunit chi [Sodalis sp.]
MKNATFYLLDQHIASDDLTAVERLACDLAVGKWREGETGAYRL